MNFFGGPKRDDRCERTANEQLLFRHSGARVQRASPESITTTGSMDSGAAPGGASRNDGRIGRAKTKRAARVSRSLLREDAKLNHQKSRPYCARIDLTSGRCMIFWIWPPRLAV